MSNTFDKVKPIGNRVLIRKIEEKERKFGAIFIPPTANEIDTAWVAEVIAVGPGRYTEDGTLLEVRDVKAGDHIVIAKYMGTELKLDGEKYYVVRADDILGVVETDASV